MFTIPFYPPWPSYGQGKLRALYRSMRYKAWLGNLYSLLTGHATHLLDLAAEVSRRKIRGQYYAGFRTVPINRIRGSEGRSRDFDYGFNPMHTRTMDRWMKIAATRSSGGTLPLIELIQLGDDYFVRDGHHRISVARAFHEEYIDAAVIVLKVRTQ